jgi:hypothetical protein
VQTSNRAQAKIKIIGSQGTKRRALLMRRLPTGLMQGIGSTLINLMKKKMQAQIENK